MAWIESHQSLGTHLKLRRLARELRVHRAQAIGHLHFLWWWALDNAPTGNLSALAPAEIAEVAEWPGSAEHFVSSLKSCGWLDDDGMIHDWMEYAGYLIQQRAKDRQRKRDARNRDVQQQPDGPPRNVQRTSGGHPADGGRTADVPNPTQPNPTESMPPPRACDPPTVEPPPGFPRTEEAAKAACAAVGCPEVFAVNEWDRAMGRGGRDSRDVPIRSWASYLRGCWTASQSRASEAVVRGTHRNGHRPPMDRTPPDAPF